MSASRARLRAVQALARKALPGRAAALVERVAWLKLLLPTAIVLAISALLLVVLAGVVGAVAGGAGDAAARGCVPSAPGGASAPGGTTAPGGAQPGGGAVPEGGWPPLNGPPEWLIPHYRGSAQASGLGSDGAAVLAAINRVETEFGANLNVSSAGAVGWMQFMPATWAGYGEGGDPNDPRDAIFAAGRLLRANGAPGDWYKAIFGYNHADWYVKKVLGYARAYGGAQVAAAAGEATPPTDLPGRGGAPQAGPRQPPRSAPQACPQGAGSGGGGAGPGNAVPLAPGERAVLRPDGLVAAPEQAPEPVKQIIAAGNRIALLPYVWGGYHALGASPGGGYDCSSAAAYLLHHAGMLAPGVAGFSGPRFWTDLVSGMFVPGGKAGRLDPGPGRWVTVYANGTHIFLVVAGIRFDNSGSTTRNGRRADGGNISMWLPNLRGADGFTVSHPPGW